MKSLELEKKTIEEGQNYGPDWTSIDLTKCVVIKKGMQSGLPTFDLQFVDEKGNKFIAMVTGGLFRSMWLMAKDEFNDGGAS